MPFVILYVSQSLGDLLPLDFLPKKWGHMNSSQDPALLSF